MTIEPQMAPPVKQMGGSTRIFPPYKRKNPIISQNIRSTPYTLNGIPIVTWSAPQNKKNLPVPPVSTVPVQGTK